MIKQSVKNYFKCFKYVFTPLGIIALGLVCGLSIAVPNIIAAISDTCKTIANISGKAINFKALFDNIVAAINALDWSDPATALSTMFSKQWFYDTIMSNLNPIVADVESYMAQIGAAVNECVNQIIVNCVVVVIFVVIAFIASYFLTKWMIRKDIAKRTIKKFIVSTLIGSVLSATVASVAIWLGIIWHNSIYISVIAAFVLALTFSLFNAYITHGYKIVPLKSVVNIKNAAKLLLSDCIIFVIGIAISVLIAVITNIIVGIFVAIGLISVTIAVMEMTAEAYVKELADKSERQCAQVEQPSPAPTEEAAATENAISD
ncbi:MAG: hypothetical protein K2I75_03945 [Clostridiales bacterium]|nr:hypothetical protein [Clostridiales bacterium]